jgi:hypothetical protein
MRLLARGEVAAARWAAQRAPGAIQEAEDPTKTGYEVPTAETNYLFEVRGVTYAAHSYGPAPHRGEVDAGGDKPNRNASRKRRGRRRQNRSDAAPAAAVLYHPGRPQRNVLLYGHLADLMRGRMSLAEMIFCCLPAPMAALAIWLLFTVR